MKSRSIKIWIFNKWRNKTHSFCLTSLKIELYFGAMFEEHERSNLLQKCHAKQSVCQIWVSKAKHGRWCGFYFSIYWITLEYFIPKNQNWWLMSYMSRTQHEYGKCRIRKFHFLNYFKVNKKQRPLIHIFSVDIYGMNSEDGMCIPFNTNVYPVHMRTYATGRNTFYPSLKELGKELEMDSEIRKPMQKTIWDCFLLFGSFIDKKIVPRFIREFGVYDVEFKIDCMLVGICPEKRLNCWFSCTFEILMAVEIKIWFSCTFEVLMVVEIKTICLWMELFQWKKKC